MIPSPKLSLLLTFNSTVTIKLIKFHTAFYHHAQGTVWAQIILNSKTWKYPMSKTVNTQNSQFMFYSLEVPKSSKFGFFVLYHKPQNKSSVSLGYSLLYDCVL